MTILQLEVPPNMQPLHCFPLSTEQTSRLLCLQWLFVSATEVSASCNATLDDDFILGNARHTVSQKYFDPKICCVDDKEQR